MKKNLVYFILYLVLLTELLVVITERDEYEDTQTIIRQKLLKNLVTVLKSPIIMAIPQKKSDYNVGETDSNGFTVVMTPLGLASDDEKKGVEFFISIAPGASKPSGWPDDVLNLKNGTSAFWIEKTSEGNGIFHGSFSNVGEYEFIARCEVARQYPSYLEGTPLMDSLKVEVPDLKSVSSKSESFSISAKRQGGKVAKGIEVY